MRIGGLALTKCGEVVVWWLQMQCFGLAMVRLDVRQESTRHSDVLDAITTYLGIGSYKYAPASQVLLNPATPQHFLCRFLHVQVSAPENINFQGCNILLEEAQ